MEVLLLPQSHRVSNVPQVEGNLGFVAMQPEQHAHAVGVVGPLGVASKGLIGRRTSVSVPEGGQCSMSNSLLSKKGCDGELKANGDTQMRA